MIKMSLFATVPLHVTRIQKSEGEKKVIAIDKKEKSLFVLHMIVKSIHRVIQLLVLFA